MKKIAVMGAGLVGATIARDLARDGRYLVTVADRSPEQLAALSGTERLEVAQADLGHPDRVAAFIGPFDVVVGALPSKFGFGALKAVIEADKPYCDISFMPEDALSLSSLAAQRGVTAVVDCGVAPGLANLVIGRSHAQLDETLSATIYVGGLPRARSWPFQYKAPFAPSDVIEEYTRPARMRRNGEMVVLEPLSEPELIEVRGVGALEAVNTDGLRSLLDTIDAPNLSEKTLRYPGHAELMRVLRHLGLFSAEPVQLDGQSVSPLALTSRLLFERWKPEPGELEFTVLRVEVTGRASGALIRHHYSLFDETDADSGASSMARTTGFPCAIVARMLAEGELHQPGVLPPELLGSQDALYQRIVTDLAERGVVLEHRQSS